MSTKIIKVTYEPLDIPLLEPFTIAIGRLDHVRNALITIELENGAIGYGEAAALEPINGENQATILATLKTYTPLLVGRDALEWRTISAEIHNVFSMQNAARAGIEMALLDAATKSMRIPLYKFLGGASSQVETDISIPIVTPARARELAAEIQARGVRFIKIKVGGDIAADVARILGVVEGGPKLGIQLDANQGYNAPGAVQLLNELARLDIPVRLFEQPVPKHDWNGMKYVTQHTSVPVAADETIFNAYDAIRVIETGAATVVNIKLMKSGLVEALDIAAVCRAGNIQLMIGGMIESKLAMCCSAHFAAGLGGFDYIDLDTPMLLAEDPFEGGWKQSGGIYELSEIRAGIGCYPAGRPSGYI
ncbi:MAG: dipeptide epimerase [Chloroflexi bacterium]|uniref:Dipeptide epimerase n=1 Tax=Candidatus Chlorohelix allophototropha TaxID=3003348 RepID=A0A8T7M8I9_9CHLR|nr:dipeptide epimerase [Chloroflexota bacterium]WJW68363.1 dipeptide epimerase [Chloroflexota bacterium L227-S17]